MPSQTVVIAAGGTAGHVVPAIAVADALRDSGAAVSFLGARGRVEAELVPAAGYDIDLLSLRPLDRRNPLRAAGALWHAGRGVAAARRVLRRRRAAAVLGGGGFVSGPAGLAAASLGLPLVLTEADRHLGLANRLLAKRARRVCLAFPIPGREGERYVVTGRPIPAAVTEADRGAARRRFAIDADADCLLVFGGSQGARSINLAAAQAFSDSSRRDFHVLHICGRRDFDLVQAQLGSRAPDARYTLIAYEPGLGDALAAGDLVLARAGGSIFEIAAAGRAAILVPYPHAAGRHQHANAEWMAAAGAAQVLEDSALDPERLRELVAATFADRERLERMSAASASLARPDAAAAVAAEVIAAIGDDPSRRGGR